MVVLTKFVVNICLSNDQTIKQFYFSLATDGVGTMEYTSGDVYHGQWYMGDIHGQVIVKFLFSLD